jgi:hypothetical protein
MFNEAGSDSVKKKEKQDQRVEFDHFAFEQDVCSGEVEGVNDGDAVNACGWERASVASCQ